VDAQCLKYLEWAINGDAQPLSFHDIGVIHKLRLYLTGQTGMNDLIAAL
jgi:hypothetical protein